MTSFQPLPESLSAIAVSAGGETTLPPNTVLSGQIIGELGEGRFLLRLGASRVMVESEQPLPLHQPLTIRVLQSGERLVLEIMPTAAKDSAPMPQAVSGDQLAVSEPFTLAMALSDLANSSAAAQSQPWLALRLTSAAGSLALHLPGTDVAIPVQTASPPGTEAAASPSAFPQPLPAEGEAILLVERFFLRASFLSAPAAPKAVVQMPISELPALQEAIAGQSELVVNGSIFSGSNRTNVKVGQATGILLATPPALTVNASALAAQLRLEPTVWLAGALCRDQQAIAAISHPLDARIKAIGLTPTPLLREAAQALWREGVTIDRQPLQALLALTAGRADAERKALFSAAAKLWAQDAPLCLPLAAGMADRQSRITLFLQRCDTALATAAAELGEGDEAAALLQAAREALGRTAVSVQAPEHEKQLADFLATSGRLALSKAQGMLEEACRLLLARQPLLRNYDSALEVMRQALALPASPGAAASSALPDALPLRQAWRQTIQTALPGVWNGEALGLGKLTADVALAAVAEEVATAARLIAEARAPATAAEIARRFVEEHPSLARELVAHLEGAEREDLRQQPAMRSLAEAAQALSDAGRRLLVYRAESLAGLRHEPAYFAAEIPFRFQEDREDGVLRLYWRRSQRQGVAWNARVVLDLQTTRLGPVVGDMLFMGREIRLRLYSATAEIADYLAANQQELTAALRQKGFACLARFAVIPQAVAAPEDTAPRPQPAAASQSAIDLEA